MLPCPTWDAQIEIRPPSRPVAQQSASMLHVTQDARLDILQFRIQLVPHPLLRLGPILTEHEIADVGNLAITQVFSMAVLAPADRIHQCPGTLLGRAAHHPELEFEGGGGIAEELGSAEARVEEVEDHEGFSGGGGDGRGEGAAVEDLEEFAVEVTGGHLGHGAVSVVEGVEDVGAGFGGEVYEVVDGGADDGDARGAVESLGGEAEFGEEEQGEEEG
jgi:hypothetical protein